jgi:hypothetical protein
VHNAARRSRAGLLRWNPTRRAAVMVQLGDAPMTEQNNIANREAGPVLDPNERPASNGKRWAILIGFAALVSIAAASINHRGDQRNEPPAASTATAPAPGSTNAVLPPGTPAAKSGG